LKHCQWLSAIGAVTVDRRTPQPAPGRRAQHSQHFSQAPACVLQKSAGGVD